jgi:aldehyde:ferredoxin oxidoreductase
VACIGKAGEKLSYVACIINDGHRAAGRGGCGAVMGSKNLKAVACVGTGKMEIAKEAEFKAANAVVAQNMRDPNGYSAFLGPMIIDHSTHGTAGTTVYSSLSGDSPIKNWGGSVPADFGGEEHVKSALHPDAFDPKYNKGPFACSQCIMHCGARYEINDGKWPIGETERPEYETLVTFGPLCLVKDVNAAFKANEVCNRTGLDTISAGSTIAWVMECYENGVLTKEDLDGIEANFGNADAMIALLEKMADGSGCGKVLKLGSYHASKVWGKGEEYLVVSQGMEPAMHDPRKVRASGYAAIYKFDPTPGRHVKGGVHGSYDEDEKVLAANADRSVPVALQAMDNLAKLAYQEIMNVTGICMFSNYILPANWVNEQISNVTGIDFTYEKSFNTGLRLYFMRQAFNIREGITREKMWISPRLAGHPALETGLNAGTDLIDDIEHYGDVFYRSMGCDIRTGIPYPETLRRIGHLDLALKIAEKYGV